MYQKLGLSLVLMLMSGNVWAEEVAANDCCNAACTCHWDYDAKTKTINITGTGAMKGYGVVKDENGKHHTKAPWGIYESEAESLNIGEGIISVGETAFYHMDALKNVSIPTSVTEINYGAFQFADLTSVVVPEGVKTIGGAAFHYNSNLSEIILPSTLESISIYAFGGTNVTNLVIPENVKTINDIVNPGDGRGKESNNIAIQKLYCTSEQMAQCEAVLDYKKTQDIKPIRYKKEGNNYLVYDDKGHIVGKYKNITSLTKQIPTEIYKYSDSGHFIGTFDAKGNRIGKKIYTVEEAMEATKYGDKFHVYLTYK